MFWGISPCLDLLEELKLNGTTGDEVNILLIGGADIRHILKTLSRKYKYETKINFYVMELLPEIIAKELLLLNIGLQPMKELGLTQKTRFYMELFGNTLVRPAAAKYLTKRAKDCIEIITNDEYLKNILPFVNLELKYKEKDYIENLFKFWANSDSFDICDCWDRRLRKTLGIRYDTRKGVFDWDLHMQLYNTGGNSICIQEYLSFRSNGVSFTWLENEVSKPNRSMVTGIIPNGDNFGHYGYLGDMQTGPFITYGVECDDTEFLKKSNNQNRYRSTDMIERNLKQIFHEIEFETEYVHQKTADYCLGACMMQLSDLKVVDIAGDIVINNQRNMVKCLDLKDVTINFMSISLLNTMKHKEQYKTFFNLIYYGNGCLKYLESELLKQISCDNCMLIVEHQLFVIGHREKELNEHVKNIEEKLDGVDKVVCPFDVKKDKYVKFIII